MRNQNQDNNTCIKENIEDHKLILIILKLHIRHEHKSVFVLGDF